MLKIGTKAISISKLQSMSADLREIKIDDCFSLYEGFNNNIPIEWQAEEGVENITVRIFSQDGGVGTILILESGKPQIWRLPNNYIEVFPVYIEMKEKTVAICAIVEPKKISKETFRLLINDLRERNLSIYMRISPSRTFLGTPKLKPFSTLRERFEELRKNMKKLQMIVERIADNPRKRLERIHYRTPLHIAAVADETTLFDLCGTGSRLSGYPPERIPINLRTVFVKEDKGYLPESILSSKVIIDYNVFENRLLKRFLRLVAMNMKTIESLIDSPDEKEECVYFRRDAIRLLRLPFLQEVEEVNDLTKSSLPLRRDVKYMRFYDIFKEFISRPYYDRSEILNIGIAEICKLYELWCVAFLLDTLLMLINEGWGDVKQKYIKIDELGYAVNLDEQVEIMTISKEEEKISMIFQHNIYSFIQKNKRPDITLKYKNSQTERWIVLDPKYRADLFQEFKENNSRSAIDDMHIYRDAFRHNDGTKIFKWAVILYPGRHSESPTGITDRWGDGGTNSGIAAFCLRPQKTADSTSEQKRKLLNEIEILLLNREPSFR